MQCVLIKGHTINVMNLEVIWNAVAFFVLKMF